MLVRNCLARSYTSCRNPYGKYQRYNLYINTYGITFPCQNCNQKSPHGLDADYRCCWWQAKDNIQNWAEQDVLMLTHELSDTRQVIVELEEAALKQTKELVRSTAAPNIPLEVSLQQELLLLLARP